MPDRRLALTAYGVLSRGLLTSSVRKAGPGDMRGHMPRFQPGRTWPRTSRWSTCAFAKGVAGDKGCTPAQLAIAWVLSRDPYVIPLMGASTRAQLTETLGALDVDLTSEDHARIDAAIPEGSIAGTRYAEAQMRQVDL